MKTTMKNGYTLVIISGYPIEGYINKGYDYLYTYYNPLMFFENVHFFEPYYQQDNTNNFLNNLLQNKHLTFLKIFCNKLYNILLKSKGLEKVSVRIIRKLGAEYTLYIHRTIDYNELKEFFSNNRVDCIRVYEMYSFELAKKISTEFNIPLVVSIH